MNLFQSITNTAIPELPINSIPVLRHYLLCLSAFAGFAIVHTGLGGPDASTPLSGDNAVEHLVNSGQYESLGEAITAARYGFRDVAGEIGHAWAQNPAHGLRSRFDKNGLRLSVRTPEEKTFSTHWRLATLGYGDDQKSVPAGELRRSGLRAEIVRPEIGLTEWFVNGPTGLEHGFTLAERPASSSENDGPLVVKVSVGGDLTPRETAGGQTIELCDPAGGTAVLTYDKLKVWDADRRPLTARMKAVSGTVVFEVDDFDAHYPVTIDPMFTQQAYLKASNPDAEDWFGVSVAVSGDTAVVGAVYEDGDASSTATAPNNNAADAGAAYVFVRSGTAWTQQAYLKASNAEAGDWFGHEVAVSGDTAVVGAILEDGDASSTEAAPNNDADGAGAVYVFVRNGTAWTQQAYLKASNAEAGDNFGYSVGVSGDTAVAGAYVESSDATSVNGDETNNNAPSAGAAYVFTRSGVDWTQQAYLKASNAEVGDWFGWSVAVSGDTAVVGAIFDDGDASSTAAAPNNNEFHAGAAYVFTRSGAAWTQQGYLKASNAELNDQCGYSVAVSGNTAVVGAVNEDGDASSTAAAPNNNADGAGAAYVFTRTGTAWNQKAYLKASNAEEVDQFGWSVAVSGNTAVLGAPTEDGDASSTMAAPNNNADAAGAAYVFTRAGGAWSQLAYLKASNADAGDNFGESVAVSGGTAVIGAIREDSDGSGEGDNSATDSSAAYVFTSTPETYRPDLLIGRNAKNLRRDDFYTRTGHRQTVDRRMRGRRRSRTNVYLQIQNDGVVPDRIRLISKILPGNRGPGTRGNAFNQQVFADGKNVTASIRRRGLALGLSLAPGETQRLKYKVIVRRDIRNESHRRILEFTAKSATEPNKVDVGKARLRIR